MHRGGVLRVGQFKGVTQTLLRPTPVAMVTKNCEFQHKIGYNSACVRDITQILAFGRGFLRDGPFQTVTPTMLRPPPVAMVTKISNFQHKIGHNSACVRDMTLILAPTWGL